MEYISSNKIDLMNSFFHFSRIDSRESIVKHGLQAVSGGENEAASDKYNKTIYFSKGVAGVLKAVDVWARWEYDRYVANADPKIDYGYKGYNKEIMQNIIYKKLYTDFKNRQYYVVDLKEGKYNDFEFGDIDVKKILARYEDGRPSLKALWEYGPYSSFGKDGEQNNTQEDWNMNTKIGERVISSDRLKIIQTENGKSDALSFIIEMYDKFRGSVSEKNDYMFEILDGFLRYAKEQYSVDPDYQVGSPDLGRRTVNPQEEKKYQEINKINPNNPSMPIKDDEGDIDI